MSAPTISSETKPTGADSGHRSIFELFAEVKRAVGPVGKSGVNQQQNYNFRGIDAVVNAAAKHLDERGVITVPMLEKREYSTVEVGKNRTPMGYQQVEVAYRFYGPRGDYFDAKVPGEAMDSGDKATAKAMSVAYRICLIQCLNLPTSDPDPDSVSYERSSGEPAQDDGDWFDWPDRIKSVTSREDGLKLDAVLMAEYHSGRLQGQLDKANNIRAALGERVRAIVAGSESEAPQDSTPPAGDAQSAPATDAGPTQPPNGHSGGNGHTPGSDKTKAWLAQFAADVQDAKTADVLRAIRGRIGQAVMDSIISPEAAPDLSATINQRIAAVQRGGAR